MHGQTKTIVITGANAGLGFATSLGLAKQGARICMVCRDPDRGRAALEEIAGVASHPPALFIADLSSQRAVRQLAAALRAQLPHIDVLVNNAGAAFASREVTCDGIERTFATNHLAPFLLTNLVLDRLREAAQGRIVNLTAGIPVRRTGFLENLQGQKHYTQFKAYRTSKISNILFTYELARRLGSTPVTVNCVHPGPVRTDFTTKAGGTLLRLSRILRLIMRSPAAGARGPIFLASDASVARVTGQYFVGTKPRKSSALTYDREVAARLWEISAQLTSLDT
jgi:retinol dehydrogenase 14